jgi:hypothetical protein
MIENENFITVYWPRLANHETCNDTDIVMHDYAESTDEDECNFHLHDTFIDSFSESENEMPRIEINISDDDKIDEEVFLENFRLRIKARSAYICDTMELLRRRNRVLAVLCGFMKDEKLERSVILIQSVARGFISRRDNAMYHEFVKILLTQFKSMLTRRHFVRARRACIKIQSMVRGRIVRSMAISRAMRRMLDYHRTQTSLEKMVLYLTFAAYSRENNCEQYFDNTYFDNTR